VVGLGVGTPGMAGFAVGTTPAGRAPPGTAVAGFTGGRDAPGAAVTGRETAGVPVLPIGRGVAPDPATVGLAGFDGDGVALGLIVSDISCSSLRITAYAKLQLRSRATFS